MKLSEITTKHTRKHREFDPKERGHPEEYGLSNDPGHFSFVKHDEDEPHMITKYHRRPDEMGDAFVSYAKLLKKKKIWNKNIHFPRIYVTNDDKDAEGRVFRDWTMEKLVSWKNVSEEELRELISRYFRGPEINRFLSGKFTPLLEYAEQIPLYCISYFWNKNHGRFIVNNDEFKWALDFLKDIVNGEYGYIGSLDLHADNVMYRRTPVGVQLVFTDPFGFA